RRSPAPRPRGGRDAPARLAARTEERHGARQARAGARARPLAALLILRPGWVPTRPAAELHEHPSRRRPARCGAAGRGAGGGVVGPPTPPPPGAGADRSRRRAPGVATGARAGPA